MKASEMADHDTIMSGGSRSSRSSLQSGFLRFIYDSDTGAVFTRTPESWFKIICFYIVYYSCLAAFFAGMLTIFLNTFIDDKAPSLMGRQSILPQNPGMGFRPQPDPEKSIVIFNPNDNKTYLKYVDAMEEFLLKPVKKSNVSYLLGQEGAVDCEDQAPAKPVTHNSKPCRFNVTAMDDVMTNCVDNSYGYPEGKPCVVVKLNKIFEFIPVLKKEENVSFVRIECRGQHVADMDNIGEVEYFPKPGMDLSFFPYLNQKNYLSPLVFVKFNNVRRNVLVQVVCQPINVENIQTDSRSKGDGRVEFELFLQG